MVACSNSEELPAVRDWLFSMGTVRLVALFVEHYSLPELQPDNTRTVQAARCVSQVNEEDLGERMSQAVRTGLEQGASKVWCQTLLLLTATSQRWLAECTALQVVVIGTDTPDLSQTVLKQAILLLDKAQASFLSCNRLCVVRAANIHGWPCLRTRAVCSWVKQQSKCMAVRDGVTLLPSSLQSLCPPTNSFNTCFILHTTSLWCDPQVVLGPAYDGGYYLVGMSYYQPALFQVTSLMSP